MIHFRTSVKAILFAVFAAALYALNAPFSKQLLLHTGASMMAALLYLGAGIGLMLYRVLSAHLLPRGGTTKPQPYTKRELLYIIAMILLDIAAPICFMLGLRQTNAAIVSLLNNFEIVATALLARFLFGEKISLRTRTAIVLVTLASIILGFEGTDGLIMQAGALWILLACVFWGLENNCTRMLSAHDTVTLTILKGTGSGLGALFVAFCAGERLPGVRIVVCILLLGFAAYGLSINFYILAQRTLGAAKTSAFYSIAPFLGVLFSFLFLREEPDAGFYLGLVFMAAAAVLLVLDTRAQESEQITEGKLSDSDDPTEV